MFENIRYRLLLSYLTVLSVILGAFAIAVRITFVRSLDKQLETRLETLAKAAALELELDGGEIQVDNEDLVSSNQGIQWFDYEGNFLDKQGKYILELPFNPEQTNQTQIIPYPAKSITKKVHDNNKGIFIGYTRVSESTQELNNTLRRLDLGLGLGLVMALGLSGLGGIWLTRQAMQPIEASFRRLQRFTSDASHELRSPLMAIKTNAAVALKYPEGIRDLDVEKFQAIKSASTQLTALTENLLLLARTDQELLQKQEVFEISTIFKNLFKLYQPQFEDKQIYLKAQLKENLKVLGDEIQLTRLFTNLIDNALRYTGAGGVIEIQTNLEKNQLTVSVKDTGIGIAPEQIEHLFERFWRADQARSYQSKGFGLGLAIAQGIAQSHGGKIMVTSKVGRGSCFTVCLPVCQH